MFAASSGLVVVLYSLAESILHGVICLRDSELCELIASSPFTLRPQSVKRGNQWLSANLCEYGDACEFAHTNAEILYHPELYKSLPCKVRGCLICGCVACGGLACCACFGTVIRGPPYLCWLWFCGFPGHRAVRIDMSM